MNTRLPYRAAAIAAAVAVVLVAAGCSAYRLDVSRDLAQDTRTFSVERTDATARLLIVGDSTAAGTGASAPEESLAGQLAEALPRVSIANRGVVGAKFADVALQLEGPLAQRYDAVLIMAGGNDVMGFTTESTLRDDVERAVVAALAIAPVVVVMPAGNVGNAPFFYPPVSWLMTARAQTMHRVVRETAQQHGASYVNLYKPKDADPFAQDPQRYHARDGLHPSDAGYAQWLHELTLQSPLALRLGGTAVAHR
jgi:lysophospholipase L1-like esterase